MFPIEMAFPVVFVALVIVVLLVSGVSGDKKPVLNVDSISFTPAANGSKALTVVFSAADEEEMKKLFGAEGAKEGEAISAPSIVVKDKASGRKIVIRSKQQKSKGVNERKEKTGIEVVKEVEKQFANPIQSPLPEAEKKRKRNSPHKQDEKSASSAVSHSKSKTKSPSKKTKSSASSGPLHPLTNGV